MAWELGVLWDSSLLSDVSSASFGDVLSFSWDASASCGLPALSTQLSRVPLVKQLSSVISRLRCSSRFVELFESHLTCCIFMLADVSSYLGSRGASVVEALLDVYDLGEGGFSELRPYMEFRVDVHDAKLALDLWEEVIHFIEKRFGGSILDSIDVFLSRA